MTVTAVNAQDGGNCSTVGCDGNHRDSCSAELAVKADDHKVACRSTCGVFNADKYCCRGAFGLPDSCQPTTYSKLFKKACPAAYSYTYDDPTSIFTCTGADYTMSFCSKSIQKRRQRVCTYHINQLICSGLLGRASTGKWLLPLLLCSASLLWMLPAGADIYQVPNEACTVPSGLAPEQA
ncbi:pathogenesis-related thaumatin-like protein 3.5 [Zingiber officinale]|uniref:pathogenesis-related thaumatin-like protein 3.5 n=1 Tax=Zingiber officinale TaxID=94328 RepID=UPI001C4CC6B5|nr:pathogenesis-related thaumatin-like protein 3.5 [Zingiber officinale]